MENIQYSISVAVLVQTLKSSAMPKSKLSVNFCLVPHDQPKNTWFGCLVVWVFGSLVFDFWGRVEGSWEVSWAVRGVLGASRGVLGASRGVLGGVRGVLLMAPGVLLGGSWAEGVAGKL